MAKRRTKGDPWVYIGFHVSPDENVSLALKKVNEHITMFFSEEFYKVFHVPDESDRNSEIVVGFRKPALLVDEDQREFFLNLLYVLSVSKIMMPHFTQRAVLEDVK